MSRKKTAAIVCLMALLMTGGMALATTGGDLLESSGVSGGVIVHVGCGDGTRTAALHADAKVLVCGLDTDAAAVAKARAHIDGLGLYGEVSAERFDGRNLPFGDNIVNLIVIERPAKLTATEVARVLTPNGVALVAGDAMKLDAAGLVKAAGPAGWGKYTKPRPAEIDEWTHYLYDATGNAVSADRKVGHPRRVQWYAGPRHTRHHDALASFSAMTTSDGRVFYVYDEGHVSLMHRPPAWKLIARDAFNGKLLWKRAIPTWMTHLYNFRAGPKQLPRRLVSVGREVFVTLGFTAPLTKLDGATGKTLLTYAGSEGTEEIIVHDGMVFVVTGDAETLNAVADGCHGYWELTEAEGPTPPKSIIAYDAATGRRLWDATGEDLKRITPLSLSARGQNVYYLDHQRLHCLDARTGKPRWAAAFPTEGLFLRSYAPTVVIGQEVATVLLWNRMVGFAVADGRKLWQTKGAMGFGEPGDVFLIDETLWTEPLRKAIWRESRTDKDGIVRTGIDIPKSEFLNEAKTSVGVDVRTGEITKLVPFAHNQHHHRCYRDKATGKYMLIGHSGIQLLDLASGASSTNQWVRGVCQYGIMPANGYLYVPPDPCQCYTKVRLNGFFTLAESNSMDDLAIKPSLEPGPAYAKNPQSTIRNPQLAWPTYRGDAARSGAAGCRVGEKLSTKWTAAIGPGLTAPVIAGDKVYVGQREAYTLHCLDRATGKPVWKFLAGGPIDSPPTIHAGLCLVGCGDGSVYGLDAGTGELAWRFKVSAIERRIGSDDRLESPLAISGAVLVLDDVVYFAAGRSSYLDGGIRLYGLDIHTGKPRYSRVLASGYWAGQFAPAPATDPPARRPRPTGALVDILVSDGDAIGMRGVRLDKTLTQAKAAGADLLDSSKGLLDDTWFDRQSWKVQGASGQLIVHDDAAAYCVINPYTGLKQRRGRLYKQYNQDGHFHQKFTRYEESFFPVGVTIAAKPVGQRRKPAEASWSITEPFQPRAMVLAGGKLYLAGWLDAIAIQMKTGRALDADNPDPRVSVLRVYAAQTGQRLAEHKLPAEPVFDGAAAAYGNLFVSLKDGTLICLGE